MHLLGHGRDLLWWQECVRAVLVLAYGLAAVRIAGRRVFGKWTPLDILVSVVVGSSLSRTLTGNAELGGTLAATTLLMALHYVLARGAAHWGWFSWIVEGVPCELGRDGQVDAAQLRAHAISRNDLAEALRQSGVEEVSRTRLLMLEPSGTITIVKAEQGE